MVDGFSALQHIVDEKHGLINYSSYIYLANQNKTLTSSDNQLQKSDADDKGRYLTHDRFGYWDPAGKLRRNRSEIKIFYVTERMVFSAGTVPAGQNLTRPIDPG